MARSGPRSFIANKWINDFGAVDTADGITKAPSAVLDFRKGQYALTSVSAASIASSTTDQLTLPIPDTFSGMFDFSRASSATYIDNTGTMQTAEGPSTNLIRNSTFQGAATGTPGTLPTNMVGGVTKDGLSRSIVSTGVVNGMNYIDVRIAGTATATSFIDFLGFDTNISFVQNDLVAFSMYASIIAGSMTSLSSFAMSLAVSNSVPTYLSDTAPALDLKSTLTGSLSRVSHLSSITQPTAATATPKLYITYALNAVIDFTIRIAGVQLEKTSVATSFIPTSVGTVTRQAAPRFDYTNSIKNWAIYSYGTTGFSNNRCTPTNGQPSPDGQNNGTTWTVDGTTDPLVTAYCNIAPAGKTLTFSVWLRVSNANGNALKTSLYMYGLYSSTVENATSTTVDITSNWQRYSFTYNFPSTMLSGITVIRVDPFDGTGGTNTPAAGSSIQTFGWQLEEGPTMTTFVPTNGSLVYGQPSLLLEGGTSNLFPTATNPSAWTTSATTNGITATKVATGTEQGMNYAEYRFQGTSTGTFQDMYNFFGDSRVAAVPGEIYTSSIYARFTNGNIGNVNLQVSVIEETTSNTYVTQSNSPFFPMDGTINRRYSTRTLGGTTTSTRATPILVFNSGVVIDVTIRFYCPQFEKQVTASSFIGSFRQPDNCQFSSKLAALIQRDKASIVVKGKNVYPYPTQYGRILGSSGTGSASTIVAIDPTSRTLFYGPTTMTLGGSATFNSAYGIATAWQISTPQTSASGNGGTVVTSTTPATFTAPYWLGRDSLGTNTFGWIDQLIIYPYRINNASVQSKATVYA